MGNGYSGVWSINYIVGLRLALHWTSVTFTRIQNNKSKTFQSEEYPLSNLCWIQGTFLVWIFRRREKNSVKFWKCRDLCWDSGNVRTDSAGPTQWGRERKEIVRCTQHTRQRDNNIQKLVQTVNVFFFIFLDIHLWFRRVFYPYNDHFSRSICWRTWHTLEYLL